MPAGNDFDNQQLKQRAQYLNMRGAQMAQQNAGQKTELGGQSKATGSKKQLIGTIIGISVAFAVILLLAVFRII